MGINNNVYYANIGCKYKMKYTIENNINKGEYWHPEIWRWLHNKTSLSLISVRSIIKMMRTRHYWKITYRGKSIIISVNLLKF